MLRDRLRRAVRRAANGIALAVVAGMLAACVTTSPDTGSSAATTASSGKAVVIVGRGLKVPGLAEYRQERANPTKPIEHDVKSPVWDVTFELRRFDPVTRKTLSSGFFGSSGSNDIKLHIDVRDAFIQEFDTTEAVARGLLSLGLSAAFKFDLDSTQYKAYEVEAGHWTLAKFTTNIVSWSVNNITHHMLVSRDGTLRPGAYTFEVKPGEVVYVGDMTLEIPLRRADRSSRVIYSADAWKMRVVFDPAAMAKGYDGIGRYPTLQNRAMAPIQ